MWILIVLGVIAYVFYLFYSDRLEDRRDFSEVGGIRIVYKELIEYFLSFPKATIVSESRDRCEVVSKKDSFTVTRFKLRHKFKHVTIVCENTISGRFFRQTWDFKSSWEDENIDYRRIIDIIQKYLEETVGLKGIVTSNKSLASESSSNSLSQTKKPKHLFPAFKDSISPPDDSHDSSFDFLTTGETPDDFGYYFGATNNSDSVPRSLSQPLRFNGNKDFFPQNIFVFRLFNDFLSLNIQDFKSKYRRSSISVRTERANLDESTSYPTTMYVLNEDLMGAIDFFVHLSIDNKICISYSKVNDNHQFKHMLSYLQSSSDFTNDTTDIGFDCDIKYRYQGDSLISFGIWELWVLFEQVETNIANALLLVELITEKILEDYRIDYD